MNGEQVSALIFYFFFFFLLYGDHRDLLSFPTRRSSDLGGLLGLGHGDGHAIDEEHHIGPVAQGGAALRPRSEEHTSELQSRRDLVCRLLLEKKKKKSNEQLTDEPNTDYTTK